MAFQQFNKLFNFGNYKKTQCKRWGLKVHRFSNVMGVILLDATIYYDSDKNYRSNKTFDEYKKANKISKSVLVYIVQSNYPENVYSLFGDTDEMREQNMDTLFSIYNDKVYDCVIHGRGCEKFKVQRSKTFYLKFKDGLYASSEDQNFLAETVTLECHCDFK